MKTKKRAMTAEEKAACRHPLTTVSPGSRTATCVLCEKILPLCERCRSLNNSIHDENGSRCLCGNLRGSR